jgi:predicted secreted acid phosphatase
MSMLKTTTHTFFAIACAVLIHTKSFAEPINLADLKTEVKAYHDSGLYIKEIAHAIAPASNYIVKRAEENAKKVKPQKLAVVLDIDETSLSNYKGIIARDFGFDLRTINREIMAADAPAIAPVLSFYRTALQHNIAVFFVTGRPQSTQNATQKNLKAVGYQQWTALYLRPDTYKQPSNIPFKVQARKSITEQGYTIIASVGDQNSDLTGGYAEKMYKLPNPYYFVP